MPLLTAKSSTIFIATSSGTEIYPSLAAVPPATRRLLEQRTRGHNCITILIADKKGKEELVRALQGEPSQISCRLSETIRKRKQARQTRLRHRMRVNSLRRWLEVAAAVALGGSLWLLFEYAL